MNFQTPEERNECLTELRNSLKAMDFDSFVHCTDLNVPARLNFIAIAELLYQKVEELFKNNEITEDDKNKVSEIMSECITSHQVMFYLFSV